MSVVVVGGVASALLVAALALGAAAQPRPTNCSRLSYQLYDNCDFSGNGEAEGCVAARCRATDRLWATMCEALLACRHAPECLLQARQEAGASCGCGISKLLKRST